MIAYLDESGSHGFDFSKEGTSTYFIINSVLIEEEKNAGVLDAFSKIKSRYFPISEMKSSSIGKKEHIRSEILEAIKNLDFKIYCLIVDKKSINVNTGLRFKESFYKFLYGIIYNQLFRTYSTISIVADEMISKAFIDSFEKYVKERHVVDLFQQNDIVFTKSTSNELLQLADIIGGSINRYCSGKSSINPLVILEDKVLGTINWPTEYSAYTVTFQEGDEYAQEISSLAMLRIDDYLKRTINSRDKHEILRVKFLSYILAVFKYDSSTRFIHSQEILRHLQEGIAEEIKEQYLRQNVVGPLRSQGILIVSNTNGYKIPNSKSDVVTFFNLFSKIISPMIKRLEVSYQALYTATNGELDILAYPEFEYLKKMIKK